jgi:hypothetical protein
VKAAHNRFWDTWIPLQGQGTTVVEGSRHTTLKEGALQYIFAEKTYTHYMHPQQWLSWWWLLYEFGHGQQDVGNYLCVDHAQRLW